MKQRILYGFFAGASLLFALLTGCSHSVPAVATKPPVTATAPVVDSHEKKDAAVLAATVSIDTAVEGTPAAPVVNAATESQRVAVASAPAAQVKAVLIERDTTIKAQAATISKLTEENTDLKDAELKTQTKTLRIIGLVAFAVAGLLGYARQLPLAAASALTGLICLGLAQLISQPWFMPAVGALTVTALGAFGIAAWQAYHKHTLAQDAEAEAAKVKATLLRVVPAIDGVLKGMTEDGKKTVLAALGRHMDRDQEAVIHKARAAAISP